MAGRLLIRACTSTTLRLGRNAVAKPFQRALAIDGKFFIIGKSIRQSSGAVSESGNHRSSVRPQVTLDNKEYSKCTCPK